MENLQVTFENLKEQSNTINVKLNGKLNDMSAYDFKSDLLHLIKEEKKDCVIDVTQLSAMDIVGMNALAMAHRELEIIGQVLTVVSSKESKIDKILSLTKFDRILNLKRA